MKQIILLEKTDIRFDNNVIKLVQYPTFFLIENGCGVLGSEKDKNKAYKIYQNKVKAFKAQRTKAYNHDVDFVKENIDSVSKHCVINSFQKRYHMTEAETRKLFGF